MQTVATCLKFPETVYIIANKNKYLLRFFATKGELVLCCHGVLGAAYYLFKSKHVKPINIQPYKKNINIEVKYANNLISMSMTNQGEIFATNIDASLISKLLNIDTKIIAQDLPFVVASVGSPKLLVPIINRASLFAMAPNLDLISTWSKNNVVNGIYAYSKDTENANSHYVGRNFNPLFSHQEDVATGSAAAALCNMLCRYKGISEGAYIIEQGANLGRPSKIYISITADYIVITGQAYFLS